MPDYLSKATTSTLLCFLAGFVHLAATAVVAKAQSTQSPLISRAELMVSAEQADLAASRGDLNIRNKNANLAASIRQRLREGDFQVGDRVVVTVLSDIARTDTLVVRAGRVLEVPGNIRVPLAGVLRSEVKDRVSTEVLKYVKAIQIDVTPLMRVGILGEVAHPGYFAFTSDIPLADAIMAAGGPTATADMGRSAVRRGTLEFRSSEDTRVAIAKGLTLDQFGVSAGDEIVVGRQREISNGPWLGLLGAVATIVTIFVALRH